MKRWIFAACAIVSSTAQAQQAHWTIDAINQLRAAVRTAPDDALPAFDEAALDAAWRSSDAAKVDGAAQNLALRYARAQLLGVTPASARKGWKIADTDAGFDLPALLAAAVADGRVDTFLAGLRPAHPEYAALRLAHATESDPQRKAAIARSMERWRWMPRSLGREYLLVNAPAFEASLWREGQRVGTWRVIVGKTSTPTPVFAATVTGVNFNPWWNVPANIVRESVGALVRNNPALARQRGYVWSGGRIRQKPGPNNALGQMKLVMPNPYSVYLHDTPNRDLFNRDPRAFSHGCVRVGDALGLAETLLKGARTRAEIDALVAKGDSITVDVPVPMPVYIAYFTAGVRGDGSVGVFPDLYGRDKPIPVAAAAPTRDDTCPA